MVGTCLYTCAYDEALEAGCDELQCDPALLRASDANGAHWTLTAAQFCDGRNCWRDEGKVGVVPRIYWHRRIAPAQDASCHCASVPGVRRAVVYAEHLLGFVEEMTDGTRTLKTMMTVAATFRRVK